MKSFITIVTLMTVLALLGTADDVRASEPTLVQVNLVSGRTFTAAVDDRSDAEVLWLRFDSGAVRLWRPVKWERVTSVAGPQGELTKSETLALASRAAEQPQRRQQAWDGNGTMARQADTLLGASEKVTGIDFTASVANWDSDVTADGLELSLNLYNAAGDRSPVGGTVEIQWWVTRYRGSHTPALRNRSPVQLLGRWTRSFSAQEMANGVTWRLPFQAANPDNDPTWSPMGMVSIKVTVPGHGTFSASRDFVRTRPASPTRDAHRQATGSSWFAGERLGR